SCIDEPERDQSLLEKLRRRGLIEFEVNPLTVHECLVIVRRVPSLSAKTLDKAQRRLLLENPASSNPLFLLVALEELRGFGSYEQLNNRIAGFPHEGDVVKAIFTQVIERIEKEYRVDLGQSVLTLLASARHGLSEAELLELVSGLADPNDLFPVLRQLR